MTAAAKMEADASDDPDHVAAVPAAFFHAGEKLWKAWVRVTTAIGTDVTDLVRLGESDEESLSLERCVCGASWGYWDGPILHVDKDDPAECDECGRKFYWRGTLTVYEVAR